MSDQPRLLLGLTPITERAIEDQLFADDHPFHVVGSAADAAELLTLAQRRDANTALVSAELPGLDAPTCATLRSHGLRIIGLALDDHNALTLTGLGVDTTITPPLTALDLTPSSAVEQPPTPRPHPPVERLPADRGSESGSVLAVLPGGGSPGASECAASLATLADRQWPTLLLELDLIDSQLALRLGVDPQHGSLLGLTRADSDDPQLPELLAHWTTTTPGWPPTLVAPADTSAHLDEFAPPGAIRAAVAAASTVYPLVILDIGELLTLPGDLPAVARAHREAVLAADAVLLVLGARDQQLRTGRQQLDVLLDQLGIPPERLRIAVSGAGAPGAADKAELQTAINSTLGDLRLAVDAWIPFDARSARAARRTGTPLAAARPRGSYTRTLRRLLDEMLLPEQPITRQRKSRLPIRLPLPQTETVRDEEVALPWRS